MTRHAPRGASRLWHGLARGACLMAGLWLAGAAHAEHKSACRVGDGIFVRKLCYASIHNFREYGHHVLGNTPEWHELTFFLGARLAPRFEGRYEITRVLTEHIFEDITPRLHDLDGDGTPEAIVVESSFTGGAALVVYQLSEGGLTRIATPPIGTRNRWLAPAGIGDLDGDGHIELAYIDRPHLAKRLRIWRFEDGALTHVADKDGLTNHRIGEDFISGGLRICAGGPEIITASANWSRIIASRLENGQITTRDLGEFSPAALKSAMNCG